MYWHTTYKLKKEKKIQKYYLKYVLSFLKSIYNKYKTIQNIIHFMKSIQNKDKVI